jgi:hypothetical protein
MISYFPQSAEFLLEIQKFSGARERDKREFLFAR